MDPYVTLGVRRNCTRDQVKAAFRAKVRIAHPDRGGDEQAFIALCAAYKQVLQEALPGGPRAANKGQDVRRSNSQRIRAEAAGRELGAGADPRG